MRVRGFKSSQINWPLRGTVSIVCSPTLPPLIRWPHSWAVSRCAPWAESLNCVPAGIAGAPQSAGASVEGVWQTVSNPKVHAVEQARTGTGTRRPPRKVHHTGRRLSPGTHLRCCSRRRESARATRVAIRATVRMGSTAEAEGW